jgi:hypothetical protein
MIKLLLSWDVLPDNDQEYFEFMVREFTPKMSALGLNVIEAWFTLYGDKAPQIVVEAMTDDLGAMRDLLATDEWNQLKTKLLKYVTNFQQKVIRGRSHLQL